MLGDGCDICNPAKALEYARDTITDLTAHRDMLITELTRLHEALKGVYALSPEGRKELERIQKALTYS